MYHTALASFCTAIWLLISVTPAGNNWQLQLRHPSLLNPLLSTPQIHLWLILFSPIVRNYWARSGDVKVSGQPRKNVVVAHIQIVRIRASVIRADPHSGELFRVRSRDWAQE